MNTLLAFLDTPLGFLVMSMGVIAVGIVIYLLSIRPDHACTCPRHILRRQDGQKTVIKIRHRENCEAPR